MNKGPVQGGIHNLWIGIEDVICTSEGGSPQRAAGITASSDIVNQDPEADRKPGSETSGTAPRQQLAFQLALSQASSACFCCYWCCWFRILGVGFGFGSCILLVSDLGFGSCVS